MAALEGVRAQLELSQGARAPQVCTVGHPHTGQCAVREAANSSIQCAEGRNSSVAWSLSQVTLQGNITAVLDCLSADSALCVCITSIVLCGCSSSSSSSASNIDSSIDTAADRHPYWWEELALLRPQSSTSSCPASTLRRPPPRPLPSPTLLPLRSSKCLSRLVHPVRPHCFAVLMLLYGLV